MCRDWVVAVALNCSHKKPRYRLYVKSLRMTLLAIVLLCIGLQALTKGKINQINLAWISFAHVLVDSLLRLSLSIISPHNSQPASRHARTGSDCPASLPRLPRFANLSPVTLASVASLRSIPYRLARKLVNKRQDNGLTIHCVQSSPALRA
jgi:hypothetical protein